MGRTTWGSSAPAHQTADLAGSLNIGPASQVALLLGGSDATARLLQVGVTLAALGITVIAAARASDPVEGLAWAVTASLVVLPVTWFHYPTALVPFAVLAVARRDRAPRPSRVTRLGAGRRALVAAALAIVAPVARLARGGARPGRRPALDARAGRGSVAVPA